MMKVHDIAFEAVMPACGFTAPRFASPVIRAFSPSLRSGGIGQRRQLTSNTIVNI